MAQSNIIVRLSLKDQEVVKRGLQQLGADGEKALKRIEAAGRAPSAGLKALGAASDELRGQLGGLAGSAGSVGTALQALGPGGLLAAAGVGALVAGFAALIRHAGEVTRHLGDINDQAQRAGTSAENMQVLRQIFIGNASSAAELSTVLEKLHNTMGEALGGNEKAIESFARAGISVDDLREAGGDTTVILNKMSASIKNAGDSAEQTALVVDLMGRSAGGSLPAINALGGEMDTLRREGLEKGTVASNETAKALADLKDKSALLDEQFSQLGAEGAVDFQRAVVDVKQALYDLESWFLRTADANAQFWQRLVDDARRARAMSRDIATTGDSMVDDLLSGVVKEPEAYGPPAPYGPFAPPNATATPPARLPPPTSRPGRSGAGRSAVAGRETSLGLKLGEFSTVSDMGLPLKDPDAWATSVVKASYAFEQMRAVGDDFYANLERITVEAKETETSVFDLGSTFQGFGQMASSAFEDAILKGEELSVVLEGLAEDMQRMLIRGTLNKLFEVGLNAAESGLSSLFGSNTPVGGPITGTSSVTPLPRSAHGNVFDRGNVIPFARGGLVDRPTLFPMARGMGLMGEAGPEAVLPLRRTPAGDLGVQAGGSGNVTVNVINNAGAKVTTEERKDERGNMTIDVMIDAVEQAMAQRMVRPGTALNRAYRAAGDPVRAR